MKPRVAFIGTGGTISSVGKGPLDLHDYTSAGQMMHAAEILERFPETREVADVLPVRFANVPSPKVAFPEWRELLLICDRLAAEEPDLAGIVVGHGTASLEETAYFLSLTLKHPLPVVVVGSQRPNSALSTDAGLNLVNALRVAASPEARGLGALVVLNDEVHAAREVTKTSTSRLQTFRAADFGCQIFWRSDSPSPSGDQSLALLRTGAPVISLILSRSSSRFAASLKPNVAYRVLNFSALWKKQTTLPSLAYAGCPYQVLGERSGAVALMMAWIRSTMSGCVYAASSCSWWP